MKRETFEEKIANEEIAIEDLLNSKFIRKYTLLWGYR